MLQKMKLGTKLLSGFMLVALIAGIIGYIGYNGLSSVKAGLDDIAVVRLPSIESLLIISEAQSAIDGGENALLAKNISEGSKNAAYQRFVDAKKRADDAWAIYAPLPQFEEEAQVWKEFVPAWEEWWKNHEKFVELAKNYDANKTEENYIAMSDFALLTIGESFSKAESLLNKIVEINSKGAVDAKIIADETTNSAINTLIIIIIIGIVIAMLLGVIITSNVKKQLGADPIEVQEIANQVADGNLDMDLNVKPGDRSSLLYSMDKMSISIKSLVADALMLSKAAVAGKLDTRADASKFKGEFKNLVDGVNGTLDAVIGPLNVAAEYVDRISKGDMPPTITDNYNGDFNEIKNNLNLCMSSIKALISDATMLSNAAVAGKLDTRADATKHQGDFRKIVEGVNGTLDAVIGPLNVAAEYVDRISKGDLPPEITDNYNGDFNEIKNNLNQCIKSVRLLVSDAGMLSTAGIEGKLDTRADATKHQGDFRKIVEGVNRTLDAVIGPLNVAAEYVDRISKGDMPPAITDNYNGDFNEIKNNLNQCITSVKLLISDAGMLSKAAVDGRLDTRADASKHQGDFRKIVEGVNATLDAVIGPLNVAAEYVDRISKGDMPPTITDNYNGDFNEIKNNLNQCMTSVKLLITDAEMLSKAAVDGRLDTRADASKHQGDFRKIVEGVNATLDSVIGPLNVAAEYVDRISKGDMPPMITDNYNGDFNEIKNNLNLCMSSIKLMITDAEILSKAAVEGRLATRADASRHQGDFRKIVQGVNDTLDAVIAPIDEAGEVLGDMANGDLTVRMKGNYSGDLSKLKEDINRLGGSLSNLVIQVNEAVINTSTAATQIAGTAETLAAAAQEQSSQADEVASAVEEMARTVTDNAMGATKTAHVAKDNADIAQEGGAVVKNTIQKMNDIAKVVDDSARNIEKLGESSKAIGEIISVIDDIADQTNLLALNAAIEAARAGEQGRGFAVVADEVRKLAERTTEATKQIADMIKGIQKETDSAVIAMNQGTTEVQAGIEYADRAGNALKNILSSSHELTDLISQIAAASEEQSATTEQISKNVLGISTATSESARQVEEVANTSEHLSQLTRHLMDLMGQFKVEDSGYPKTKLGGSHRRMLE